MSLWKMPCMPCRSPADFAGYSPYESGQGAEEEPAFVALWHCAKCNETAADFCTMGPTFPPEGGCPWCGGGYGEPDGPCLTCRRTWIDNLHFHGYQQLPTALVREVVPLVREGLARRALGMLAAYRTRHPLDAHAVVLSGEVCRAAAMPRRARLLLERALVLGAPNKVRLTLSDVYSRLGDPIRAEGSLRDAVRHEPQEYVPWLYLCAFLEDRGDPAAALREVDTALAQTYPAMARAELLETRAAALCSLRRGHEALASADEACALAPGYQATRYVRGRALALIGRQSEARAQMEQIIREAPGDRSADDARAALEKLRAAGA